MDIMLKIARWMSPEAPPELRGVWSHKTADQILASARQQVARLNRKVTK